YRRTGRGSPSTTLKEGEMGLNGSWVVESIEVDGQLSPPVENSELTLEFEDGQVFGKAINRLRGTFSEEDGFGPMMSTMMAGPPELMDQEHRFLTLLEAVDGVSVDRVNLTVNGRIVIVLTRGGTEEE